MIEVLYSKPGSHASDAAAFSGYCWLNLQVIGNNKRVIAKGDKAYS
jgi:hypothetical protein